MKIETVTITGADNNTNVKDMIQVSSQFPFVEWGILFSPKRIGEERYPNFNWLAGLKNEWLKREMNLSAHLCGEYTREMLQGERDLIGGLPIVNYWEIFGRFQLNFNAKKNYPSRQFLPLLKELNKEFILQYNNSNILICINAMKELDNVSFLYDSSGGRGTINDNWQHPFMGFRTGYAGGLSPDNLKEELTKIEKVAGDRTDIWIDTETHVRTNGVLDMEKVKRFLSIASQYVS